MQKMARLFMVLTLGVVIGACSRAVSVSSEPGTTYSVLVTNRASQSMDVAWNDGSEWRSLGTVSSGAQERFIIAAPRQTTVSIRGTSASRTSGPYTVTLTPGAAVGVTLR